MNQIPAIQNAPAQIKLMRARKQTYAAATSVFIVQLLLTIGLPVAGGVFSAFYPDVKPYIGAASLAIIIIDAFILDRHQKNLIKRAAKIGEQFDCVVLELPWDQFTVGDRMDAEDIHAAARIFAARYGDAELMDWYPLEVGEIPLHLARIVCQRTNLHYDSRLRRSYGAVLKAVSLGLVLMLVVSGLVQDASMTAWVLTLAPATPFLAWAAREYYRQVDTADLLDSLKKEARKLWDRALAGECGSDDCLSKSREFQSAIYSRRAGSPLVLPFIYRFRRSSLEEEMGEGASAFLLEYMTAKTPPAVVGR